LILSEHLILTKEEMRVLHKNNTWGASRVA